MSDYEYLVFIYNQDADEPITRHPSLDAAKQYIRDFIADPENDPAPTAELISRVERDLADPLLGVEPFWIYGEMAWSERIWIVPVPYCEQGKTLVLDMPGGFE
jgi:hypothetical protein